MKKVAIVVGVVLSAAAVGAAGTELSLSFGEPVVSCPAGDVRVDYTVTSTGAASAASVTETLTQGQTTIQTSNYLVAAGNVNDGGGWTFAGRYKTRDGVFQASGLANGSYSLEVCTTQAGSNGNPSKTVCKTLEVVVNCAEVSNPCASASPIGEVVGNDKIRPFATAQINFRGNFGDTAFVEILDANGFYRSATVGRNGDSCNYHANWKFTTESGSDLYGNNGPGVYTVKVSGNGNTLEFAASLKD